MVINILFFFFYFSSCGSLQSYLYLSYSHTRVFRGISNRKVQEQAGCLFGVVLRRTRIVGFPLAIKNAASILADSNQ